MEQAVIVHLKLSNDRSGTSEEREAMHALEEQLEKTIEQVSVSEFDGREFGNGECVFFMYGVDADKIFTAIQPILNASSIAVNGYAIKRYGEAGDYNASEVRITWDH